jgi:hypothetical protein
MGDKGRKYREETRVVECFVRADIHEFVRSSATARCAWSIAVLV